MATKLSHASSGLRILIPGSLMLILLDESSFLVHWLIDFSPGQNLV
jgi:hypothetical protein